MGRIRIEDLDEKVFTKEMMNSCTGGSGKSRTFSIFKTEKTENPFQSLLSYPPVSE